MPDEPPSSTLDRELTSTIVAAYVRQNQITSDQLGALISTVHQALTGLEKSAAGTGVSEHLPSRSGDPFTAIMSCAWTVAGAARCSSGMSQAAMDLP
jgi:hypothetical protein